MKSKEVSPIVFYDGDCGFCSSTVQFILKKRKEEIQFSPLQSEYAHNRLKEEGTQINLDTIYLLKEGKIYERSSAALQISKSLKGLYPLMVILYVVPKFIRDGVYNSIAKRRHRIRAGYCVIPSEEEKKLFIDAKQ